MNPAPAVVPPTRFLTSDGVRLAYFVDDFTDPWQPPDTLVMLHSVMGSHRRFYAMVPKLVRHFRVVRLDWRGHGESDIPPAALPLDWDRLALDVVELLDHLGVADAHLLGLGNGGGLAMQVAISHPARAKSVCAFAAPPGMRTTGSATGRWIELIETEGLRAYMAANIESRLPVARMAPGFVGWFLDEAARNDSAFAVRILGLVARVDFSDQLDRIQCPTLIVKPGAQTHPGFIAMQERIKGAKLVSYDGLPQCLTDAVPERCADEVLAFLGERFVGDERRPWLSPADTLSPGNKKIDDIVGATAHMMDELERDPIFLPSQFWRSINQTNVEMIQIDGIENFKRSVSQNYYNWLVIDRDDVRFRQVMADAEAMGATTITPAMIDRDAVLRVFTQSQPFVLSDDQLTAYGLFVACLWDNMIRRDTAGLNVTLAEPEIGNPIRIRREGKLIAQDLANSILECNMILPFLARPGVANSGSTHQGRRSRVAEIGAGYGRLAHVFAATQPGTYHIFDIPPALYVAQWYLGQVMTGRKLFEFRSFDKFEDIRDELEESDIAFFSANQLRKFPPGYFDVIQSISTLPEMRPDQVTLYLDLFQSRSSGLIYLKQWRDWTNPSDGTHLRTEDYVLHQEWKLVHDGIDPVNPIFFNRLWERTGRG